MNSSGNKPHVLHVDDEDDFLELFSYAFNSSFEIESINNGKEAIEIVRKNSIDAVVTDYDMPGINGLELLRRIKEVNPDIPVVLQTGQGNEEVAREAFILGASDYFTKDFFSFAHKEKFVNAINNAVEIKKARFEKKLSEKKYRTYIENAPESVFVYDGTGKITEVNRAAINLTGYSKEELLNMSLNDLWYLNDFPEGEKRIALLREKGKISNETAILRKDGSRAFISIEGVQISPDIFISFCKDITEFKRIERQKTLSIEILEMLNRPLNSNEVIENILTLVRDEMGFQAAGIRLRKRHDFPYIYTKGFCPDFVEKENSLIARDEEGEIIRDNDGNPLLECLCGNVISGRTDPSYPFFTRGGSFWTNSTSVLLASTNNEDRQTRTRNRCHDAGYESVALIPVKSGDAIIGLLQFNDSRTDCFTLDIIEFFEGLGSSIGIALDRISTAKQIRDLSKFPSENPSPVMRVSDEGIIIYGNAASTNLFNYWNCRQGEKLPDYITDIIHKNIEIDTPYSYEIICKDRIFLFLFTPIRDHGYINIYGTDITEKKLAEDSLKDSESRMRSIFRAAPVGIGLMDEYRNIIKVNKEMCDLLGYTEEEMYNKTTNFLYPTESEYKQVLQENAGLMERRGASALETRWKKKDGKIIDILFGASPVDTGDLLKDITFTAIDITNRKAAEEELRKSEAKFRSLTENIPDLIARFDREYRHLFVNRAILKYTRLSEESLTGKTYRELDLPGDFCDFWENAIKAVFETGMVFESEFEMDIPEAEGKHFFNSRLIPERDETGNIISVMSIARDITRQREIERNYRLLFNEMMAGVALHKIICDDNGKPVDYRFLDVNVNFVNLTGLQREKIIGKTVKEILPDTEAYWIEKYGEVALTGKSIQFEDYSGELGKYFEVAAYMTKPGHFACIFHDVTERKKAEAEIQKSLVEKEILLREIHHRVKNNLQIIISLLDMQSHTTDNREVRDLLETCIHRVNSMSLIHQKLYRSTHLAEIDMKSYVHELINNLIFSYREIDFIPTVSVDIEDIYLKIDYAIPCGLILNELITNCLKHAFKGRKKGRIDISMKRSETGIIELTVKDNGIGIPGRLVIEKLKTLGLSLVNLLADQIKGTLEFKKKRGSIFIIRFNAN